VNLSFARRSGSVSILLSNRLIPCTQGCGRGKLRPPLQQPGLLSAIHCHCAAFCFRV